MNTPEPFHGILFCQCEQARLLPAEAVDSVQRRLREAGAAWESVPDLCGMAARRDPALKRFSGGRVKIAACFPRAVKWLFAAGGADLSPETELLNLRTQGAGEVAEALLLPGIRANLPPGRNGEAAAPPVPCSVLETPQNWMPWFPVIDYDRCVNCKQCLGFCLFGVYGVDGEKRIQVQHPHQCKNGCPACARVCPEAAIIFPKYKAGPINGDSAPAVASNPEKVKVDLPSLLGGDVHAALRARGDRAGSRFSVERDADKAQEERKKCLSILADTIPPEVIKSLPSPEELVRRAREAQARVKAAGSD